MCVRATTDRHRVRRDQVDDGGGGSRTVHERGSERGEHRRHHKTALVGAGVAAVRAQVVDELVGRRAYNTNAQFSLLS